MTRCPRQQNACGLACVPVCCGYAPAIASLHERWSARQACASQALL